MSVSINGTTGWTFADSTTQNTGGYTGFRNRIINGAMVLDQRNAGASVTANNVYCLDRWLAISDTFNKWNVQQNVGSVTPPVGFKNYVGGTSSSAYTPISTDYFGLQQRIEGYNVADLAWGTANAASVTLSFWARSSLTGTFGGALLNNGQDRSYPFSYTISSANTWEYKTITVAGDTTGTWATDNGAGLKVHFSLGAGSSRVGTANAWTGTANVFAPSGAVNVVGTSGATFYITGVQLEKGSVATPFEVRPYGTELQLCQRYAIELGKSVDNNQSIAMGYIFTTTLGTAIIMLPVPMRTTPSLSYIGTLTAANISRDLASFTVDITYGNLVQLSPTLSAAGTANSFLFIRYANQTTRQFLLSAEL